MRLARARAVCRHLTEWGHPASVERRGRTFGIVVHLPDGRVAVWGDAPGGRMRAVVLDGDELVALLPATEGARTPAQRAARIASVQYGPRVQLRR